MLFDDKLLFIHAPKTAGTSVTSFLIANLSRGVTVSEPTDKPAPDVVMPAAARLRLGLRRLRRRAGLLARPHLKVIAGTRHETLAEAAAALARLNRRLEDFRAIIAIVRDPYDLEVSRYHFFRRGYLGVKGVAHELAEELAQAGDFEAFALKAPYHGRLPSHIEDWYEIDGRMPGNLTILRFENLESELLDVVGRFYSVAAKLPRLNASKHAPYASYLSPAAEEAIYQKYRWLFDRGFYRRQKADRSRVPPATTIRRRK
jgi:hypothetical protein